MKISKQVASQIVQELENIIEQQINLMDENSIIIASSTPERIGTVHEGGLDLINQRLPELAILPGHEYKNTKPGINLPIEIDQQIIGVVGITGNYDEVSRYGKIIKKMTEILLQGQFTKEMQFEQERAIRSFMRRWILEKPYNDTNSFITSGKQMGIDIQKRWYLALLQPNFDIFSNSGDSPEKGKKTETFLMNWAKTQKGYLVRTTSYYLAIFPKFSFSSFSAYCSFLKEVQSKTHQTYHIKLYIGSSKETASKIEIQNLFQKAKHALDVAYASKGLNPIFYEDIPIEVLLSEVSEQGKTTYINKVFCGFTKKEIEENIRLLQALYREEGSISKAAEKLFIHKNTLQYKLNKLYAKTSINPRSYNGIAMYQLAIQILNSKGLLEA